MDSPNTSLLTDTSTSVDAIQDCLLSVITRFTRFSTWPPDLTLLDLGANSFDVVRISAAMETHFNCHTPSLAHILLTGSFRDVVRYLWAELNGSAEVVCSDQGEVLSLSRKREREERERSLEPPSKRAPQPLSEPRPPGKPHPPSEPRPPGKPHPPSKPIRAWRRGQFFYNGV